METVKPTGCCDPFDPAPWQGTTIHWHEKPFIRADVRAFLHIPLGVGKTVTKALEDIRAAGVLAPKMVMLANGRSPWKTEVRFETTGPVPGYPFETISGTFLARAFDGPWSNTAKWHDATRKDAEQRDLHVEELHEMWTTCPACAKAYGHNWVVILAKVAERTQAAA